jgi:hypothetical protein
VAPRRRSFVGSDTYVNIARGGTFRRDEVAFSMPCYHLGNYAQCSPKGAKEARNDGLREGVSVLSQVRHSPSRPHRRDLELGRGVSVCAALMVVARAPRGRELASPQMLPSRTSRG